jgi:sterol desaturase/sphingolipid hydroxylase (fatty acid hydroxylase superfamily)
MQPADYEMAAFFALAVVFGVCEHLWPARSIDRWRDLRIDVLSFAFALAANRVCTRLIRAWVGDFTAGFSTAFMHSIQNLPSSLKIVFGVFVVDFIIYWIHRAQHHYSTLWRTHAWHHSIEQMYWFAGFRTSFLHSLIYNIPQVVVPVTLLRLSPAEAGAGYCLALLIQFWEHTNLNVNVGPLSWLIITPAYHRVHHSATVQRGKNLGTTFSIWDRLFGTYVDPESMADTFPLGLGETVPASKVPRMFLGL